MELYKKVPRLCTIWCSLEVMLYAGQIFGWSSLLYVLKEEGFYANVCNEQFATKDKTTDAVRKRTNYHVELNKSESYNLPEYSATLSNNSSDIGYFANSEDSENNAIDDPAVKGPTVQSHESIIDPTYVALNEVNGTAEENDGQLINYIAGSCSGQDSRLNLWFSIGVGFSYTMCAFLGPLMRKIGMRFYRVFFIVIYVIGALCLGHATPVIPWLICPGLCCIGIAGMGLYATNLQVSFLFINVQSTITALLVGLFDVSTVSQQIVKIAFENNISRKYSYIAFAILHVALVGTSTFLFLPADRFEPNLVKTKENAEPLNGKDKEEKEQFLNKTNESKKNIQVRGPALRHSVCCSRYLLHLYWMCVNALRFVSFLGFMNAWLSSLFDGQTAKENYYLGVFSYITLGTIGTAITAGLIHDSQRWKYADNIDYRRANMPIILPLVMTTLLSILCTVLTFLPYEACLYITFILFTFFRSYVYSYEVTFVNDAFPMIHFTELYGILQAIAGLGGMLQYGLFEWFEAYSLAPIHVNIFLLILEISTLSHPFNIWYKCYQHRHDTNVNCVTTIETKLECTRTCCTEGETT